MGHARIFIKLHGVRDLEGRYIPIGKYYVEHEDGHYRLLQTEDCFRISFRHLYMAMQNELITVEDINES